VSSATCTVCHFSGKKIKAKKQSRQRRFTIIYIRNLILVLKKIY